MIIRTFARERSEEIDQGDKSPLIYWRNIWTKKP